MTPTSNLIRSSSGVFAFGFCRFDPNLHPEQFILAIWFDFNNARDCTNKPVVWFARDIHSKDAVIAAEKYVLDFQGDGSDPLSLVNAQQDAVWTPNLKRGSTASTMVLQESGNLQLFGGGDDGTLSVLWESFSDPTDTLLPGNNITNNTVYLQSRKAYTNFSSGRFTLAVQSDSNIVTYTRDQETGTHYAYWATDTDYNGACVPTHLFFNESGIYYNLTNCIYSHVTNGTVVQLDKSYTQGYYKYMALDPDGIVRVYVHPKNNRDGNWDMVGLFPTYDGCSRIRGICGPNSYCTTSPDKYRHLDCSCPESYQFLDAQQSYKGCTPSFIPHICDGKDHSAEFKTVEMMQNTSWSTESTYKKYPLPPDGSQGCSTSCLSSCLCVAVLIDDSNNCMELWTLTAGIQANNISNVTMKALIKVRQSNPVGPVSLGTKLLYTAVGILAIVSVASVICNLWQSYVAKRKKAKMSMSGLTSFTYKEMIQATGGFEKPLGSGSFGKVYKGELSYLKPPYVVAVKKLNSSEFGERDFDNEVQSMGHIHHKNLARLIGYCKQGVHRMLVFQYMQGGTLADFIFGSEGPRPHWSFIAEAAIGIARGLEYLHEGCKPQIIHCDIKPENILFDDTYTPKITDFGVARLLGDQKTQYTLTGRGIAGTISYAAPEWSDGWWTGGKVDNKVDVYSFGVMLLEMICCRRAADGGQPNDQGDQSTTMRAWVESLVRSGKAELLVEGETEALADTESVERFARVAIWCLQEEPSARPRMRRVVQMLEGTVDVDPLPDPPRPPTFSSNGSLPQSAVALEID